MQTAWGLAVHGAWVSPRTVRGTRSEVIKSMLDEYQGLHERRYPHLTKTQFWRMVKHKYCWTVRKVELRLL